MKCEKWNDQYDTGVEQRKKSESSSGIKPMTSQTLVHFPQEL